MTLKNPGDSHPGAAVSRGAARGQGVCIFIGAPGSVILLRAERLIQLSCYMANPASGSEHYPAAGAALRPLQALGSLRVPRAPLPAPLSSLWEASLQKTWELCPTPGSCARLCGLL